MTISQVITALPPAPQRTDPPSVFVPKADAHVASLDSFVTEVNTLSGEINDTAADTLGYAQSAGSSASAADTSAIDANSDANDAAQSAAIATGAANYAGLWHTLTGALSAGSSVRVINDVVLWVLLVDLADITTSMPAFDNPDWSAAERRLTQPLIGGSTLSEIDVNELTDSGTITANRANGVPPNWYVDIIITSAAGAITPTINARAGDTFTDGGTPTTSITPTGPTTLRLISNGINQWRY